MKLLKESGRDIRRVVRAINGIEQSFDYFEERYQKFVNWESQRKCLTEDEQSKIIKAADAIVQSTKKVFLPPSVTSSRGATTLCPLFWEYISVFVRRVYLR